MKHKPFRGLGAILFKEFIVVWRDPLTLFFFFFPPLIEMVAFGYALDNDVKHMAMLVLNEDRTVESRQLIDRFVNTQSFRVVGEVQSLDQLKSDMRKGRAYAALYIPPNFTRELMAGHSAQVELLVDGSNSTTALQALQTGLGVALTQSMESLMRDVGRTGMPIDGNVFSMMFSTLVYVFALLSLGLLVGTRAENQMQALQMSMVFLLPSVFFSGFIFPRETMPWIFYALGALFPTTYFIALMRAIILRGATLLEYWQNLVVLMVMSILLFSFCALRFRRKIA